MNIEIVWKLSYTEQKCFQLIHVSSIKTLNSSLFYMLFVMSSLLYYSLCSRLFYECAAGEGSTEKFHSFTENTQEKVEISEEQDQPLQLQLSARMRKFLAHSFSNQVNFVRPFLSAWNNKKFTFYTFHDYERGKKRQSLAGNSSIFFSYPYYHIILGKMSHSKSLNISCRFWINDIFNI